MSTFISEVYYALFILIFNFTTGLSAEDMQQMEPYSDSLMNLQILMCGYNFICDKTKIKLRIYVRNSYSHLEMCPRCSCDDKCLVYGNCCPDKFFDFPPQTCRSSRVLRNFKDKESHFLMVNSCPSGTSMAAVEKCTKNLTSIENLKLPPVTKKANSSLTFTNKHCAECNGVFEYDNWEFNMECEKFADFNFLSSYEEIVEMANNRTCDISFWMPLDNAAACSGKTNEYLYNKCNVTGTWADYDLDVQHACESTYKLKYGIFKNIFCFMCNPPKFSGSNLISECNSTGMWEVYDVGLKTACLNLPSVPFTRPFKNIFCYLCNTRSRMSLPFVDIIGSVDAQEDIVSSEFSYEFLLKYYDKRYFETKVIQQQKFSWKPEENPYYMTRPVIKQRGINMTNLLQQNTRYFLSKKVCDSNFYSLTEFTNASVTCRCLPPCSRAAQCCNDFALTYPTMCLDYGVHPSGTAAEMSSTFVVSGCFRQQYIPDLSRLCTIDKSITSNILEYLPLNVNSSISYKNVFCYLCDVLLTTKIDNILSHLMFADPWNIKIDCNSYIDYKHHLLLHAVLQNAHDLSCNITLLKNHQISDKCNSNNFGIDKCNLTGQMTVIDDDVKWACEELEPYRLPTVRITKQAKLYKNEFCIMCNYDHWSTEMLIFTCNATGEWTIIDPKILFSCINSPVDNSAFPYKNRYCRSCNEPTSKGIVPTTSTPTMTTSPDDWVGIITVTFRKYLSFKEYEHSAEDIPNVRHKCIQGQIYDESQGVCRNQTCFAGKVLHHDECLPFLTQANHLRYMLTLHLYGFCDSNNDLKSVMKRAYNVIHLQLEHLLETKIQTEDLQIVGNICPVNRSYSMINFYVKLKIYFEHSVPRMKTETALLNFTSHAFLLDMNTGNNITVRSEQIRTPIFIRGVLDDMNNNENCEMEFLSSSNSLEIQKYRLVHVLNILTCKLIWFSREEVKLSGHELIILPYDVAISYDDFQIRSDGDAYVCWDRVSYQMTHSRDRSTFGVTPSDNLTFVCISISLICLAFTFLTYCLFPQLRTLPGKNNMFLMFSLFCAHLCMMLLSLITKYSVECKIFGVIFHYFWLCVFANFNVCCFFISRAFSNGFNLAKLNDSNRILLKTVMFSFGVPAVLILGNIVLKLVKSSGQSIGYGGSKCFLLDQITFLVTFLIPISLMNVYNIICFVSTVYFIKTRPKVKKSSPDKNSFLVYIRLFLVTGTAWALQIVDSFLPLSFLSYVIAVLNALQGFFLFYSYVCKKRVFLMYSNLLNGIKSKTTQSRDNYNFSGETRSIDVESETSHM